MDSILTALSRPGTQRSIFLTTGTTAALALLAYSTHCYQSWYALGEGGIPRSVGGWLFNVSAHLIARRDTRAVPAPYETKLSPGDEEKYGQETRVSFLASGTLPRRNGDRPTVPTTVVPQRQTSATAGTGMVARQNAYLKALARANSRVFRIAPSGLESRDYEALWLSDAATETVDPARVKWFPGRAPGEIVHVHGEGSAHLSLSLADAAEVVRKGWGERHKLSGVRDILPWSYVMVYAPREEEWETWREIVCASARVVARSAGFEGEVVDSV
ncbi:hypothetical protein F5Y18DRAFT_296141 [Xylariaceae sp. FL1019]|nr:hypothetical protein F5Y18DRAFT_296141 [Xylariaceae sp. FL1019]